MSAHTVAQLALGLLVFAGAAVTLIVVRLLVLARRVRVSGRRDDRVDRKSSS